MSEVQYIGRLLLDEKFVNFVGRLPKLFKTYYERHIEPGISETRVKLDYSV